MSVNLEKYEMLGAGTWPDWAKNPNNEELVDIILTKLFEKLPDRIGHDYYQKQISLTTLQTGDPGVGVHYFLTPSLKEDLPSYCERLVTGFSVSISAQGGAFVLIADANPTEDGYADLFEQSDVSGLEQQIKVTDTVFIPFNGTNAGREGRPDFPLGLSSQEMFTCLTTIMEIRDLCGLIEKAKFSNELGN
jgi:hypothetical protein